MTTEREGQAMKDLTEEPAGFWVRLLAHIVDNIVLFFLTWGMVFVWIYGSARLGTAIPDGDTPAFALASMGIHLVTAGIYYTVAHARFGTTFGKWPVGIQVVDAASGLRPALGQSALRSLGYLVSHLTLEIGFLMVLFRPDRRGLHEMISRTWSIRRP